MSFYHSGPKTVGICAHSYEGAALCFTTACKTGEELMGEHFHPEIILSAVPMGLSMPAWERSDYDEIAKYLTKGIEQLAKAGAHFFVCPDNTAHIVLEKIAATLPIPGIHIAETVCNEIILNCWKKIALLGTDWTMTGPVYADALNKHGLEMIVPGEQQRMRIHHSILNELCHGLFKKDTISFYYETIDELRQQGAEAVILGCTEIPLIITPENSSLPVLDSTRLLATYAVRTALSGFKVRHDGWIELDASLFASAK